MHVHVCSAPTPLECQLWLFAATHHLCTLLWLSHVAKRDLTLLLPLLHSLCPCPLAPCRSLGLTRTNVYAGMAGFYLIREKFPSLVNGPELPGMPCPAYDGVIPLSQVRELPLVIQDRSFTSDSQLW